MQITQEAARVRYLVTGDGGLDLRDEKLTWGQACDRLARTQAEGANPAVVVATLMQVCDWAMDLRTGVLDYILGVPIVVAEPLTT